MKFDVIMNIEFGDKQVIATDIETNQLPSKGDYLTVNNGKQYHIIKICRNFKPISESNIIYVE